MILVLLSSRLGLEAAASQVLDIETEGREVKALFMGWKGYFWILLSHDNPGIFLYIHHDSIII